MAEKDSPSSHVRLLWCDSAGVRRCRVVPEKRYPDAIQRGIGLTKACMSMPVYGDVCIQGTGFGPVGEVRLMPDDNTKVALPWCKSHYTVLVDMHDTPGAPWEVCPRTALKRALKLLEAEGVYVKVGFELEFLLLEPPAQETSPHCPVDHSLYSQSSAVDKSAAVLDDISSALESMGIGVLQYHAESAPGQFEFALAPFPALEAADKLLLGREAVVGVAAAHGLRASFIPKMNRSSAGNGCHCHFSLVDAEGQGIMLAGEAEGGGLNACAEGFLAGILSHLPALLPWTAPSSISYARLQPSCWAGAFHCWGYDNRECPLRVTSPPVSPSHPSDSTNAEMKAFDGSTNPYLGVAALVVAGLIGMKQASKLPEPLAVDPGSLPTEEQARLGLSRLPTSLSAAINAFREDADFAAAMKAVLGEALVRVFMAVREAESDSRPILGETLFKY